MTILMLMLCCDVFSALMILTISTAATEVMILTPNDHPNMNLRLCGLGDSL
jgi:hypothetical protein